jgi:hypothetical protein
MKAKFLNVASTALAFRPIAATARVNIPILAPKSKYIKKKIHTIS